MAILHNKKIKKYIFEPIWKKSRYFFCFLSKKTKKREYLFYQKCYEKYYGKVCDKSYKKFWRMMLRKSVSLWFMRIGSLILIISLIDDLIFARGTGSLLFNTSSSEGRLTYDEIKPIIDELEKQWAEEDRLEALQKESKKGN